MAPATHRPERPTSWQTFLRAHWGAIAAADFFTTEVRTWHGLVTFYTVFVIDLASRRVQILGSTPHPDETFMSQMVRNFALADAEVCRVLICDRDAKWSRAVRARFQRRRDSRRPDTRSGTQCQRVRRTVRPLDQRGVSEPPDSDRKSVV